MSLLCQLARYREHQLSDPPDRIERIMVRGRSDLVLSFFGNPACDIAQLTLFPRVSETSETNLRNQCFFRAVRPYHSPPSSALSSSKPAISRALPVKSPSIPANSFFRFIDLAAYIGICGGVFVLQRVHFADELVDHGIRQCLQLLLQWCDPLGFQQPSGFVIAQRLDRIAGLLLQRISLGFDTGLQFL